MLIAMSRIPIFLTEAEHSALLLLSEQERRDLRDQAAHIIRRELVRLHLLVNPVTRNKLKPVAVETAEKKDAFTA